ncbi:MULTISPECIES: hypothetical protein [Acinetobacter]|uniref:Uncharacterized protein n=1 Tax=Acinetobacter schindleri CIP 107287 TaxID=1217988 RepID=N8Z1B8_9GAMM|nr:MULTISPECIES: hypothetical protein [Acinetobacter]ENV42882.1 hypothetical protein F955_03022 [Acinetobacter schindleri CIP 107287]ENW99083.1 hypothetical protein F899_02785 [Acinetobacter sp. CIP 101934]MCU4322964.1 hypothetical protein [Acinetobacter schindleri]
MSVEQRHSSKLLVGIIGALVTVVILVFAYQWFSASSSQEIPEQETVTVTPAREPIKTEATAQVAPIETEANLANRLVQDELIKAPVPENPALAKEEISRLEDIQSQLDEQKIMLDAQHKDADELIRLKEEQIKLLEAQLGEKS